LIHFYKRFIQLVSNKPVVENNNKTALVNKHDKQATKMTAETKMEVSENGADQITEDIEKMFIQETPEDDDSKYTDEDKVRRVIVKNFDFSTTAEELEEFFEDEKFGKIEHISRKFNSRQSWKEKKEGKPVKKKFNGVVILTFPDEEGAQKFVALEELKIKERKIKKYSLEEAAERREKYLEEREQMKKKKLEAKKTLQLEGKKKKAEESKKKAEDVKTAQEKAKSDKSTSPSDCIVVCRGFHMNASSLQEVMKYFYDNHENVIDVNMEVLRDNFGNPRWDDKAFVTFMNKGAADKFKGLAYVRFKGKFITRSSVAEFKEFQKNKGKKGVKEEKAGVKRKLPEEKKSLELEKGAAIKITGITNKNTKALDIKDKLKNLEVKWDEVVYVDHQKGGEEALVRLKGAASQTVTDLVKKLNEDNIMMGDLIKAEKLTGKAEKDLDEKAKEYMATFAAKKKNKKQKNEAKAHKDFLENY